MSVLAGIKEIKEVMAVGEQKSRSGHRTIVFVDEVHRFNKAQQDAFLPHVEAGTSSTKTMVRWPERDFCSPTAITSLISLMPARTALKETNSELVRRAMRRARVVFPQPGGPQKSMEPRLSFSI